jgi:predicted acylesterase/phospholipase RssA
MQTDQKTAFVFAGGGSLGAIQVGMLRSLLSAGVQPDFVVGISVGAINAGYFAGAPNAEGVEKLAGIWSGLRRSDVFPVTFASGVGGGAARHSSWQRGCAGRRGNGHIPRAGWLVRCLHTERAPYQY